MDIRKLAEDFTNIKGNGLFSPDLFVKFYEFIKFDIESESDPYNKIAEICELKETNTPGCYVKKDGVTYYNKTELGFTINN